jgi:hypothetical protein
MATLTLGLLLSNDRSIDFALSLPCSIVFINYNVACKLDTAIHRSCPFQKPTATLASFFWH